MTSSAPLPSLAVVLISYNTAALTLKAVKSVLASEGVRLQVWLVDNNSHDASLEKLQRKYKLTSCNLAQMPGVAARLNHVSDIQFLRSAWCGEAEGHQIIALALSDNLGFARANNLASFLSQGEAVFFLNTDAVIEPATMAKLWRALEKPRRVKTNRAKTTKGYGLVAAHLRNPDGTVQRQGGSLPTLGRVWRWMMFWDDIPLLRRLAPSYQAHEDEARAWFRQDNVEMGWVGGTALMARRDCFEALEGFDPAIFMYAEDIDLCWRAHKLGWQVGLVAAGNVEHIGSASGSSRQAILGEIKGMLYLWHKHRPGSVAWLRWILRIGLWWRVIIFGILRQYGKQRIYQEALALVR
jgi:N-acetylglucosaminyl-diphospho-decaprenol L-rhamnosyltransferase